MYKHNVIITNDQIIKEQAPKDYKYKSLNIQIIQRNFIIFTKDIVVCIRWIWKYRRKHIQG
jgi:hypothetical protein